MATQPVLAGYTLPWPKGYRTQVGYRGGGQEMANGTVVFDLVTTAAKRVIKLEWPLLTDAQRTTVENAFAAIKASTGAFTSMEGTAMTVSRDPSQNSIEFEAVPTANGVRWRASLSLREV